MLMFVVGNIANFVARAFASQSLLTGLGSVQFISNLVFVVLVLREKVPRRCILATFLIVAGNVLLVVFGSKTSPKYTVSQLAALYRQDSMAAYMIMAYGGGILGAHAVLFATSLCIIIVDLIGGSDVFTEWYTYLGLLLFPAVVIVPMLEIQWVLFIMVSGGLYFGDFETFSKLQLAMFGVGVFVLLLGIFCLIPDARPEAPALEEALRTAGFGRDEAVFDNPAYIHSSDKSSSGIPRSKSGVIPASAARRIEVRPKRSSIAIVTDMGKQAKQSIFQSAVNTATLTAGMGTNKHLRAMTIFAMPMIMPSMAFTSRQDIADQLPGPRIGIEAVYNRVSKLLSADISPDVPSPMFEREPAAVRLPTPRNSMS
ncbi:TPA: hypothetical protein ACH3X1_007737 [Trebouxia sp. C0004]